MGEIVTLVVPWVVSTWCMFLILARDENRMSADALARAWPTASRRVAVVYFGVLSMPVHFWRTRRSWKGLLQGLGWAVAIGLLDEGLADGLDELVKLLTPTSFQ